MSARRVRQFAAAVGLTGLIFALGALAVWVVFWTVAQAVADAIDLAATVHGGAS